MARKSGFMKNVMWFSLFALAFYGGWVLYERYESDVERTTERVGKTIKATKKVWKE